MTAPTISTVREMLEEALFSQWHNEPSDYPEVDFNRLAQTVVDWFAEQYADVRKQCALEAQSYLAEEFPDDQEIAAWLRYKIDKSFDPLSDEHYARHKGEELMSRHGDAIARFEAGDMSGTIDITEWTDEQIRGDLLGKKPQTTFDNGQTTFDDLHTKYDCGGDQ